VAASGTHLLRLYTKPEIIKLDRVRPRGRHGRRANCLS
jgi:hypothetical protein